MERWPGPTEDAKFRAKYDADYWRMFHVFDSLLQAVMQMRRLINDERVAQIAQERRLKGRPSVLTEFWKNDRT